MHLRYELTESLMLAKSGYAIKAFCKLDLYLSFFAHFKKSLLEGLVNITLIKELF